MRTVLLALALLVASTVAAEEIVLEYRRYSTLLGEQFSNPIASVFADGRLVARFSEGHRRAGTHVGSLEQAELASIRSLAERVRALDSVKLASELERRSLRKAEKGELFSVSDSTISEFHFGGTVLIVEDVQTHARRNPDLGGWADVAALERLLLEHTASP